MELVALKTDLAFRAVFGRENERCKTALKSLLNTMLDLDIADITYVNPLNLQEYVGDKPSEMDIEVETQDGELIDVEIQLRNIPGFRERIVHYGARMISDALKDGESYNKMRRCKVLSLLDFTLFSNTPALLNRFTFREREQHFEFSDILELVFLEMTKLAEKPVDAMNDVEKWLYFLRYVQDEKRAEKITEIIEESEGMQMAYNVLYEVSADERLRHQLRAQERAEHDRISEMEFAKEEGIELGVEKEKLATAQKMLLMGFDNNTITQITDLSLAALQALRQQMS